MVQVSTFRGNYHRNIEQFAGSLVVLPLGSTSDEGGVMSMRGAGRERRVELARRHYQIISCNFLRHSPYGIARLRHAARFPCMKVSLTPSEP